MNRPINFSGYQQKLDKLEWGEVNNIKRPIEFRAWCHDTGIMWGWKEVQDIDKWWLHSSLSIMQYTGFLDKHGKKIFEGDLIRTPAGVGRIEWGDGCYRIYWNKRDNTTLHDTSMKLMEIIGNVFENPELLK